MVDEEYYNSSICQKCANCCKSMWIYTANPDHALRFSWFDNSSIKIKQVKEGVWRVMFNIPCKQLEEKDGKYWCKVHDGVRPSYCKTFPANFKGASKEDIEDVSELCPIIKKRISYK